MRVCFLTALLYPSKYDACKCVDKSIRKIYMTCVRMILGVRDSTNVDLCLHEEMITSMDGIQHKFLEKVTNKPEKHRALSRVMEMGRNVKLVSSHTTKCKFMSSLRA